MPGPMDMPLLISQMTHVQKFFNAELIKPELQHALVINPNENELNKAAKKQIQKVQKEEKSNSISTKDEGHAKQQASPQKRESQKENKKEDESSPSNASPWSGNIINVKI